MSAVAPAPCSICGGPLTYEIDGRWFWCWTCDAHGKNCPNSGTEWDHPSECLGCIPHDFRHPSGSRR